MKVKNKLFVFALILSLILSASAVVAQDNISFDQSELKTVSIETDDDNIKLDFLEECLLYNNTDEEVILEYLNSLEILSHWVFLPE